MFIVLILIKTFSRKYFSFYTHTNTHNPISFMYKQMAMLFRSKPGKQTYVVLEILKIRYDIWSFEIP